MAITTEAMVTAGLAGLSTDKDRLDTIDRYIEGDHDKPYTPTNASAEYLLLAERSICNWMPLIVKTPAQALSVSGYRTAGTAEGETSPEWQAWQSNRMDSRQNAVHFAALSYGLAYVTVLPDPITRMPKMRGVSPRRMYASYADPASDALPLWALEMITVPDPNDPKSAGTGTLYTNTSAIPVTVTGGQKASVTFGSPFIHGVTLNGQPVCPVVRFAPDIDLEGRVKGLVWPLIPNQDRANQTTFDRLVAQTFGSFKVRTISGMAPEFVRDADGNVVYDATTGRPQVVPIRADASRFMVAPDKDTKFQTLDETPLDGFLAAYESDVKTIAAVSQTPPHYLLGSIVNLSAEALAAAEAALTRAVHDFQFALGESWETTLALAASILGRTPDPQAQVTWADYESRSFSQTVDGWGKAVQMLGVPAHAAWRQLPGVTETDVQEWLDSLNSQDPAAIMADSLANAVLSQDSQVRDSAA